LDPLLFLGLKALIWCSKYVIADGQPHFKVVHFSFSGEKAYMQMQIVVPNSSGTTGSSELFLGQLYPAACQVKPSHRPSVILQEMQGYN
jgi:hypothetical protein